MLLRYLYLFVGSIFLLAPPALAEPVTVPYVDLSRYSGIWFQIARKNAPFENGCVCSRQALSPTSAGTIAVYNSCNLREPGGALREIRGALNTIRNYGF